MSYFLPTFWQKRILRYALSRLELLDTDALDLENLDIVWGRKSTIELRDVGIHIENVSILLKLPPSLIIQRAKISTLRVTVPADLYKSIIVLEVEGVDIAIRADTGDDEESAATKKESLSETRPRKPSKTVKADRPRSKPPIVHDPGGWPDSDESTEDEAGQLPTTLDLAQSFVQAEAKDERSELQAAVAQSLHLQQSQTLSEDGLDASEVGVGNEVYLPAFLAEFLKGVRDRVQVNVTNVKVDLDLRLAGKDDTQSVEDVKLRLTIGSISIDEVSQKTPKMPTRRITMKTVALLIISEPSLFSYLARYTAPSSPQTTQASVILTTPSKAKDSPLPVANANLEAKNTGQSVANLRESQASIFSAQDSAIDDENPTRASSERPLSDYATPVGNHYEDSMFSDSFYSSGGQSTIDNNKPEQSQPLRDSSIFGTAFDQKASIQLPHESEASQELSNVQDSTLATFGALIPPNPPDPVSETVSRSLFSPAPDAKNPADFVGGSARSLSRHSSSESRDSTLSTENLSESKIFSHEEAESMYMSAMSTNPVYQSNTASNAFGIREPGIGDDNKQASQLKQPKNFRQESELEIPPQSNSSELSDEISVSSVVNELGQLRTSKTLLGDGQEQTNINHNIDPAIVNRKATVDLNIISSQHLGSQSSGGQDHTVLAKRILLIDDLALELPIEVSRTSPQYDQQPAVPSMQEQAGAPHAVSPENGLTTSSLATNKVDREHVSRTLQSGEPREPATAITVGNIEIVGDVGLTKLTILMIERLRALHEPSPNTQKQGPSSSSKQSHYVLVVGTISWKFLDLVNGFFLSENDPIEASSKDVSLSEGCDVLLKSEIDHVRLSCATSMHKSTTKLSVGKFTIGYADSNILSFDASLRLRDSTRDISVSMDKDIDMTIVETKGIRSVEITTLPLHIVMDLRRLDETFGWFGGFSSMLGLGSSMMSTVTLLDPKAKALPASKPQRGVHFESPADAHSPRQVTASIVQQQKITARMGGLVFSLQGTKAIVQLESTAMKLVSRTEGVGLQIDRLVLNGPITDDGNADLPIFARLLNVRIEYLTTPKEHDLTRLLTLLAPSKDTYDDGDDILVDTLIRQRKKGGVLRATVESANVQILDLHALQCFPLLFEEAKKLSTVAKYLPEDDRPGLLTLLLLKSLKGEIRSNNVFGNISFDAANAEIAHVTFPTLLALGISHCDISRNDTEKLVRRALFSNADAALSVSPPVIMARFIGNEMEPTVKIKFHNAQFEYHVATVIAFMKLKESMATEELVSGMISSVARITSRRSVKSSPGKISRQESGSSNNSLIGSRTLKFDVVFRDSIVGLNPRNSQAKGLVVLTDTHFIGSMPKGEDANASLEIRKAVLMIIDDLDNIRQQELSPPPLSTDVQSTQIQALEETGYVSVSQISAAKVVLQVVQSSPDLEPTIDVEIRDDLFVFESCADSTQTVSHILSGLEPPMPQRTALKYQTEVIPVEDMLASFSGEAFEMAKASYSDEEAEALGLEEGDLMDDEVPQNLEFVSSFYNPDPKNSVSEAMADSELNDDLGSITTPSILREIGDKNLLQSFKEQTQVAPGQIPLDFNNEHFGTNSAVDSAAHRRKSKYDAYSPMEENVRRSQLRIRVRDVHIIWNLFDGYDWQHTRDAVSQAVAQVQQKAVDRQAARKRKSIDPEDDDEDVIGDFLFNSIYIGIPAKSDPTELSRQVNRNIDDLVSETGSYATSTSAGASPNRAQPPKPRAKRLRLQRSKHHKLTFELRGVCADFVRFAPGSGETESSLDIRVQDLDIFDHVPTSTWKKFATYMHDAGERESDTSMVHIEILNVKPVPNLAASEIVLKASILPLRLHVDQDALDFMTRFFEFKDDSTPGSDRPKPEAPFIQRAEIKSIRVRLDFKPKRVNYAGLRSGRTTEFMNFFVLDSADMVLRHAIIYGVSGFDRLGKTLNDIWMPDIKRNQLPGVLAGLAPVRSLVNVGGGVRDLVVVPIREYKKDGRIVRSFQKGAVAFAKTTTSELMRLGAKLAIGTQTVLQGAEDLLSQPESSQQRLDIAAGWDDSELDEDEKKQISLYADQPVGVVQGLRGAYASLERDLLTAKDAVVAMPGEIMESGTAGDAARALLRGAPTVILRPAMGVSKAVGQTLMGATNSLDPGNRRRFEDKYKKH